MQCIFVEGRMFLQQLQVVPRSMQDNKQLTAKCFLKSQEIRQKYECGICSEICMKPVRCRGPCARIFCMRCVSDTRQSLDKCPYRCSSPFLVASLPELQLDFHCPYDPTNCAGVTGLLRDFTDHHLSCPFVSAEEAELKRLAREYRCLNSHQLQFFIGSYEEMIQSTCRQCNEQKLCRSFCRICQEFYCVSCRVPPCSKQGCPIGHAFNFQRIANLNCICDICGISTAVSNDGVYDDNHCNFCICQACFQQLPPAFDKSKPRSIIANINTSCSCGSTLKYQNKVHQPSQCQLCKKEKECPKGCENCGKRYCLACKLMDVYADCTCSNQHIVQKYSLLNHESYMQRENRFGCMRCSKKYSEYFYDQKCCTRLCQECFNYCIRVTIDKQRPVLLKCDKNHVLMYITGTQDHYDECCKCSSRKIIKLVCNYCEDEKRNYCFQCKPLPLQTCYYQHKLRLAQFESERECHLCMAQSKVFHYCKKCFFYACPQCHGRSIMNHHHLMEVQSS